MKKIITLFAAVLLVASSFAQYHSGNQKNDDNNGRRDAAYSERKFKKDHGGDEGRYLVNTRDRNRQLEQVNREYDRKIEAVQHKWFMSRSKKEAIICSLQNQRRDKIRMLYEKFNHGNNRFDDEDSRRNW